MPIRFRCSMCQGLLSIARRKAGTQVECPKCGYEVWVPEEDEDPGGPAPAPVVSKQFKASPGAAAPFPHPAPDHPLFEHSDFDRLLDAKVKQAISQSREAEPRESPEPVRPNPGESEGIRLGPGAIVLLAVSAIILIVLAFVVGFLAGS